MTHKAAHTGTMPPRRRGAARWRLVAAAVAAAGLALAGPRVPGANAAPPTRLVLAHGASAGSHAETLLLKPWAQRMGALSGGRLAIALAPGAGAPATLARDLADGDIDLAWLPADAIYGAGSVMEVFELPFLGWPATATSQAAMTLARRHRVSAPGLRAILFHTDAPAAIHMRDGPVRRLEDLRGRRVHAPTRLLRDFLERAGADARGGPGQTPESVAAALGAGALDGAVASFARATPTGILGHVRFHTLAGRPPRATAGRRPGLGTIVYALVANADRLDRLTPEDRALLLNSADPALAETAGRIWDGLERLNRRAAHRAGQIFYALPDTEMRRWRRLANDTARGWIADAAANGLDGAALIAEARRLISTYHALMADENPARTRPARGKGG